MYADRFYLDIFDRILTDFLSEIFFSSGVKANQSFNRINSYTSYIIKVSLIKVSSFCGFKLIQTGKHNTHQIKLVKTTKVACNTTHKYAKRAKQN